MAFTAKNGKRVTKNDLRKWKRQIDTGIRSRIEVERTELGDLTGRGKSLTRIFATELA